MKSHIKAVHRDEGFDMKTWIKCGLLEIDLCFPIVFVRKVITALR